MKQFHYLRVAADGHILGQGSTMAERLSDIPHPSDTTLVGVAEPAHSIAVAWWDGIRINRAPARPSASHKWSRATHEWVLDQDAAWAEVRAQRDALLTACDWVTLRSQEQGTPVPAEWLTYRQALRDVTQQSDPTAIAWPSSPL